MKRPDSITLPQTLVLTVCLGATSWLFHVVWTTFGSSQSADAKIEAMAHRLDLLEARCDRR